MRPIVLYVGQKQLKKVQKIGKLSISKNTTNIRETENANCLKKVFAQNAENEKSTLVINPVHIAGQKILHTTNDYIK